LLYDIYASGEAKPKISFPFFVGSPHTPRRKSKRKEGKFLVFAPATEGSGRGAQISRQSDCFGKKFGFCSGDIANQKRLNYFRSFLIAKNLFLL